MEPGSIDAIVIGEEADERSLVRRGEQAALFRIGQLKAVNVAQERRIALLTEALSSQHELLHDAASRVAKLADSLPPMESAKGAHACDAAHAP